MSPLVLCLPVVCIPSAPIAAERTYPMGEEAASARARRGRLFFGRDGRAWLESRGGVLVMDAQGEHDSKSTQQDRGTEGNVEGQELDLCGRACPACIGGVQGGGLSQYRRQHGYADGRRH